MARPSRESLPEACQRRTGALAFPTMISRLHSAGQILAATTALSALFLSFTTGADDAPLPSVYPIFPATDIEALTAKDGQKVIVYGETNGSGKSGGGTNFVNFKDSSFYLITFKSDLKAFGDAEPADAYEGKRVAVTGVISIYQGKTQIKLTDPEQVRILAEDESWPKSPPAVAAPLTEPTAEPPATTRPTEEESPKKKPPVDAGKYFK